MTKKVMGLVGGKKAIVDLLFGESYQFIEDTVGASNATAVFVNASSITTPTLEAGTYLALYYFEHTCTKKAKECEWRILLDGVQENSLITTSVPLDNDDMWRMIPIEFVLALDGTVDFDLEQRRVNTGVTAVVSRVRLALFRTS